MGAAGTSKMLLPVYGIVCGATCHNTLTRWILLFTCIITTQINFLWLFSTR